MVHSLILHDGIIQHHKESFDKFVTDSIRHVIEENSLIVLECENMRHVIKIKNVKIERCKIKEDDGSNRELWPRECILRKQTYASAVYGDIVHNEEYKRLTDDGIVWELVRQTVCHEVLLCEIPVMLRSVACYTRHEPEYRDQNAQYDFGGNFIINGAEKVLVPQEKLKINHVFIFECREQKYWLVAEIRSCNEQKLRSTSTLTVPLSNTNGINKIDVRVPYIAGVLPLYCVMRLLGFQSKEEAIRCIVSAGRLSGKSALPDKWMDRGLYYWVNAVFHNEMDPKNPNFDDLGYRDIVEWVGCRGTKKLTREDRYKYVHHIMENELLPHIATENTEEALDRKRRYFAFLIYRLATTARQIHHEKKNMYLDDRDHYGNKKIETSGLLMALCLRQNWRNLLLSLLNSIRKTIKSKRNINVADMVQSKRVTDNFKYALSTGKWGVKKGGSTQTGVAQVLKRMVMVSWLGHLRRLNTPINREGRNPRPRQLQFSHWGVVCPATTPEGLPCGLIKSMALGSRITVGYMSDAFIRILMQTLDILTYPMSDYSMDENMFVQKDKYDIDETDRKVLSMENPVILFVNGISIGLIDGYEKAMATLYKLRRKRLIPRDTSIFLNFSKMELYVTCDDGGIRRPLYVLQETQEDTCDAITELWTKYRGPHQNLFDDLMTSQLVEFVDKHEESNLLVWSSPEKEIMGDGFTHMEIHPILLFSETTALIPFSNHNPAPRNTYQTSMGQASIGVPGVDTYYRSQTYRLNYAERPLCRTFMEEILNVHKLPAGQNPVVAIIPFTGYNQEDSILMNKDAIDLGYFRCTFSRAYTETVKKGIGVDSETFGKPGEMCTGLKAANYNKLTKRGVPNPGTIMHETDIIIGKKMIINNLQGDKHAVLERDQSTPIRRFDNNVCVESIMFSDIGKNRITANVKARGTRIPEQGDKFSSRHGQKGVIGLVVPGVDLPYNPVTGITPTICVNALAFPSRMTAAHTIECFQSKAAALRGEFADATPFEKLDLEEVEKVLEEHGYHKSGKEKLVNGKTGEEMEAMIFMGPTYYQRLKQMVKEKIHGRARGPKQVTSRQATEGRARDGGLRLGEMERDCIASHMAAHVLKDRYLEQSDDYITYVCANCGLIAEPPSVKRKRNGLRASTAYCRPCDSGDNVYRVRMTYNYKLLVQEAAAMGVAMRFRLETPIEDRDLEACASIGVKVKPSGEVIKPKRMKKESTLDRDVTLLTGAYAELTQGPTGDLKPLSELLHRVPKPTFTLPSVAEPPTRSTSVPGYEIPSIPEGQSYNPIL